MILFIGGIYYYNFFWIIRILIVLYVEFENFFFGVGGRGYCLMGRGFIYVYFN